MKFLENHLSNQGNKFLESDSDPTLADITLLPELDQIDEDGFNFFDFAQYPLTKKWMANVKSSLKSYDDVFRPVSALGKEFKARQSQSPPK
jgi:glutathione S-transferase